MFFTLFICLGTGTFGVAGLLAGLNKAKEIQIPAVVVSLIAIVLGGLASFLHLEHWDRAFNGFGHLTSGITQELIGIVVFAVVAIIYLVLARRGAVPAWAGWLALIVSVVLVIIMSASYGMSARPVWDTPLLWLYYLSNAALSGALVVLAISALAKPDAESAKGSQGSSAIFTLSAKLALGAAVLTLIALLAYAVFIPSLSPSFTSVGNYFDPTQPTKVMDDPQGMLSGFLTGDQALLFWVGALVLGALVPGAAAFFVTRQQGTTAASTAGVAALCALAGALCFRVVLYALGFSVFVFY
jgi:anaerobic dimethyl sulfoxide reductase subunit C (anchor subunit)